MLTHLRSTNELSTFRLKTILADEHEDASRRNNHACYNHCPHRNREVDCLTEARWHGMTKGVRLRGIGVPRPLGCTGLS